MLQHLDKIPTAAGHRIQASQDRGATAAEYALTTSFIALAVLATVLAVGANVTAVFADAAVRI